MLGIRVPRELLRRTAVIRDFEGSGARGPVYAEPREVRCAVQDTIRYTSDARGNTVTVTALVTIRPEDGPVRPESVVDTLGTRYRVVQCVAMPDSKRPSHYELSVGQYVGTPLAGSGS